MPPRKENIRSGMKFGRYTVIKEVLKKHKTRRFLCRCDCGNENKIYIHSLRNGDSKSCGCARTERFIERNTVHNLSRTNLYYVWASIKQRCLNKNHKNYHRYGGRGIEICKDWMDDFMNFRRWATLSGYSKKLTIERKNNDLGYSPDNCEWIPQSEQAKNTCRTRNVTINGETKTLKGWAAYFNLNHNTVYQRVYNGKTEKEALGIHNDQL